MVLQFRLPAAMISGVSPLTISLVAWSPVTMSLARGRASPRTGGLLRTGVQRSMENFRVR